MTGASAVGRPYARALFALAAEEQRQEAVAEELARFARLLAESAPLRAALTQPWVKGGTKGAIAQAVAARLDLSPLAARFLGLVAQRRRMAHLPEIQAAYAALVDAAAGRARARIRSAAPLDEAERAAIRDRLSRRLGKVVLLESVVDPSVLAGFVAEVGGRILDASVAGQLTALRERIVRGSA